MGNVEGGQTSQAPTFAGVRIARRDPTGRTLGVQAAGGPRLNDRTFDYDGARVYLGPVAVERLHDAVLDARRDAEGRIEFFVRR